MIKAIQPQYQSATAQQRVGLTHASKVIERLMRVYGLQDELMDEQEFVAAELQTEEFSEPVVMMPSLPVTVGTQSTFGWFQ